MKILFHKSATDFTCGSADRFRLFTHTFVKIPGGNYA